MTPTSLSPEEKHLCAGPLLDHDRFMCNICKKIYDSSKKPISEGWKLITVSTDNPNIILKAIDQAGVEVDDLSVWEHTSLDELVKKARKEGIEEAFREIDEEFDTHKAVTTSTKKEG